MRLSVFALFAALFVATAAGHIYTIDGYLNYTVTRSLATRGALDIPRHMMTVEGRDGRSYSKLGVAQSLVSLPLFWTGSLVERVSPGNRVFAAYSDHVSIPRGTGMITAEPQDLVRVSDADGARVFFTTLTNALVTALVCLIFWSLLRRHGLPRRGALAATCLLAFATPYWVYSRDYFAEPLFAACLLAAFYLVTDPTRSGAVRRVMLAGLAAGVGILTRPSFAPLAAILAAYLILASGERRRGLALAAWFALGCLPGAAVTAGLNAYRFGGIFTTGYHTAFDRGFSLPLAKGVLWNLASPYRSILLYAPGVIIFAFGIQEFLRRHRAEALLTVAIAAYILVAYSKWWAWHGGWCWGPRFLLPAIPLLLVPGLVAARTRRWLRATAAVLGLGGLAVQVSAVLINYTAVYDYWIKIKQLDWAEAGIEQFSPIWVHFRALSATGPRQYDLWLVQASRVIGWNAVWIAVALVAVAWVAAARILRPAASK